MLCKVGVILVVLCASAQDHDELLARTIGSFRKRSIRSSDPDCGCNDWIVETVMIEYIICATACSNNLKKATQGKKDVEKATHVKLKIDDCLNRVKGLEKKTGNLCKIALEEFRSCLNLIDVFLSRLPADFTPEFEARFKSAIGISCNTYNVIKYKGIEQMDECHPPHDCNCATEAVEDLSKKSENCKFAAEKAFKNAQGKHIPSDIVKKVQNCFQKTLGAIKEVTMSRNRYQCAASFEGLAENLTMCKNAFKSLNEATVADMMKNGCHDFLKELKTTGRDLFLKCIPLFGKPIDETGQPEGAAISKLNLAEAFENFLQI